MESIGSAGDLANEIVSNASLDEVVNNIKVLFETISSSFVSTISAFFGGDVNQDGTVDASDMAEVDNDNAVFAFGYNVTDVSGDGTSDASDISIIDNNQALFLFYARPY